MENQVLIIRQDADETTFFLAPIVEVPPLVFQAFERLSEIVIGVDNEIEFDDQLKNDCDIRYECTKPGNHIFSDCLSQYVVSQKKLSTMNVNIVKVLITMFV